MQAVRSLLLTDVVDSTKLSQALGDLAMADLWAAHDRVARDLLGPWRGREIDKTDGMLLLFDSPADAAQYALAYHQALAGLQPPLLARAGLHVGPVLLRENLPEDVARGAKPLEVDGLAKPTAARVMALGRGGQTLITAEAHQALAAVGVPAGLSAQSHGHWTLKGVAEPLELFELAPDGQGIGAPDDADKAYRVVLQGDRWLPVRQIDNNLPAQLTSFVGRGRELAELKVLLGQTRMITLLGMGGLGKTRLSLQLAAEQLAEFPDGVWFLDLAPLRDGALVLSAAAQALGVREEPGRALQQSLVAHVQGKRLLLILDNCEHLVAGAARLAHALLQAAPQLTCIASSREALRLPGERVYPILPLAVPGAADSAEQLAGSPAVQLFVQRAQTHRPDFTLGPDELPAVAALVARLEGIPLALELAAARVRSMSVADINRRLAKRYQVLTGGSVVLAERQQTLRALVDWSYDMLSPTEQCLLQRVAVFAGGFALDAAEQVCADGDLVPDWEVPDLLGSLVEKSLLGLVQTTGAAGSASRYQMLETLRDYAAEKLAAAGDRAATAARHCGVYFTLAKQARDGLQGPAQGRWLDRLSTEHDNLRVAMATAQAAGAPGGDLFVAVKLAVALQNFWIMRGHVREGRDAVNAMRALPAVQASDLALGHVLYVAAALASVEGDPAEALRLLDDCLARRRALGNSTDVAATLSTRSVARLGSGDAAGAQADAREALAGFSAGGHRVGEAITLLQLGEAEAFAGDDAAALAHLQAARRIVREIKHPETEGEVERALGELALASGQHADAADALARSLAVCIEAGDLRGEAQARAALARADLAAGQLDAAAERLQAALATFDRFAMRAPWLVALEDTADLLARRGDAAAAVALAAAAQTGREAAGLARAPHAQAALQLLLDGQRQALGAEAHLAAWQHGQGWDLAETHRQALRACAVG